MASIKKLDKNLWQAEVRRKDFYKSKRFLTKFEAQVWAVELEKEVVQGSDILKGKTLNDVFDRYLKEIAPSKKGFKREFNFIQRIKREEPITHLVLLEFNKEIIDRWITRERLRVQDSTVNRYLNILSAVFESAVRWNWIKSNPCKGTQTIKSTPPRDRRISDYELDIILKELDHKEAYPTKSIQEVAIAWLIAIETAMRQGELYKLRWSEVYLDKKYVTLLDTKNGTNRNVALSNRAVDLFKLLLPNVLPQKNENVMRWQQSTSQTLFYRAVRRAGIEDLTFHDARHEALTRLARKIDVLDLARMVGHRDLKSLMIYYNATASEIAARLD